MSYLTVQKNKTDKNEKQAKKAPKEENIFEKEQPLRHPLANVVQDGEHLKIDKQLYRILVNKNDALDIETLRRKYDPYLNQYDFLVGDISSDHLRLKGFYKEVARTAIDRKERAIGDYLSEYCNPGSAYFILELLAPVHHYKAPRREHHYRKRNNRRRRKNSNNFKNFKQRRVRRTRIPRSKAVAIEKNKGAHHSFVIKKKKEQQ